MNYWKIFQEKIKYCWINVKNRHNKQNNFILSSQFIFFIIFITLCILSIFFFTNYHKSIIKINEFRQGFNFLKLKNNKFLILGGESTYIYIDNKLQKRKENQFKDISFATNTAEIFDPITLKSEYTTSMNLRRNNNFSSLVLKAGKVIVIGAGYIQDTETKEWKSYDFAPVIDIYNPMTKKWCISNAKLQERKSFKKPLLQELQNGNVFICSANIYEIYNPITDSIIKKGYCPYDNLSINAINLLPDGRLLVRYSYMQDKNAKTVFYYDLSKDSFEPYLDKLDNISFSKSITLKNGNILYINENENILQLYNIITHKFEDAGKMLKSRLGSCSVELPSGNIFFVGGDLKPVGACSFFNPNSKKNITCELYNPKTKTSKYSKKCFNKNSAVQDILIENHKLYLYQRDKYPSFYNLFSNFNKGKIEILNIDEIE